MQPQNRFARPSPDHSLTACWHRNDHDISIRCLRNKRPSASAQAGSQQPLNPQVQCCQECAGGSFGLRNKRPLCAGRPPSRAMSTLNLGGMGAPENQSPSRHGWAFISQTPESNFALLKARFLSFMFLKKDRVGEKGQVDIAPLSSVYIGLHSCRGSRRRSCYICLALCIATRVLRKPWANSSQHPSGRRHGG